MLREKRGWTQTYMAVHLGLDRSYISDLESGKREICIRNLEVIALGFEITPAQLLSRV
jgi:transcriptional regulator with XRE-family HTH domain